MPECGRPNLYVDIHKGIRQALFEAAMLLGSLDWTDAENTPAARAVWDDLVTLLRAHVEHENGHMHPVYRRYIPGLARALEADHEEQETLLAELDELFGRVEAEGDEQRRVAMGLELYRGLNEFIGIYLPHFYREEAQAMRSVWDVCTPEELYTTLAAIMNSEPPELGALSGRFILRASNHQDRVALVKAIQGRVAQEIMAGMQQMAQQLLPPKELEKMGRALG